MAANIVKKGVTATWRSSFTRQQLILTLERSSTLAYAQLRYAIYKKSFEGGVYENETEHSKYGCDLKRKNIVIE